MPADSTAEERCGPPLILGAWQLSEGHSVGPPSRASVFDAFAILVDAGFTTFDCADIYTGVEELLGEFRRDYARRAGAEDAASIRIHTKLVPDRDRLASVDRRYVERIIDRSLQRLGVDRLDLVQFAWWDYTIPGYVDVALWLDELRRAGKIDRLGTTNFNVKRLEEMREAGVAFATHQVQYSVIDRRPEQALVDWCRTHGGCLLCYGALGGGLVAERWRGAQPAGEPFENRSLSKYALIVDEFGGWATFQELLSALHEVSRRHDASIADVAVRWVLDRPMVGSAIIGTRSSRHMASLQRILRLQLDHEDRERIASVQEGRGPAGDVFGLEREPGGRHAAIMRYNLNRA